MSIFPTPYVVDVHPVIDGPERDNRGALKRSWGPAKPQRAIGWSAVRSEQGKLAGHNRLNVDCELYVPEEFECGPDDEIVLPDSARSRWRVIGYAEDYCNGPFNFRPGMVVNLRRVEG